ncbi:hypothetical protein [Lutibacter sp. B1]|uniref:hypothetical protein n=1 Tax=Lutibacter sp. B1 TaxID=2725996 RepID=UPI0014577797|nr:hypothetical protein [Lutibacter sp. B1]
MSLQDSALLKKAISINLLQQKCKSTAKEEVENSMKIAKKKVAILVDKDFTP